MTHYLIIKGRRTLGTTKSISTAILWSCMSRINTYKKVENAERRTIKN